MKKINIEWHKQRISLLFLFSGVVLIFLLLTSVLVGLVVFFLINHGALQLGETGLNAGSLLLNLILWSLLIGAVLSFLALRFPLKPINKILNAMSSLAAGDYSVRLGFKGVLAKHPTVAELTDSFNKMASELEHTEMLRSDFVNNFSHEFKTPIVSIAGFAKLLQRGNLTDERKTEYLNIIEEESLRLSQMATNVLNLTKVENQSILTDVTEYNLSEQIRTCVLVLESKWSKKHIDFSLPNEEYYITANEELMKQVWINLIDNAIKFSQYYGMVDIYIGQDDEAVRIAVSNYGEEIPEDAREKIFSKFYQADESHATEGNGVGLAVVKKIADLHGGSVGVTCAGGKTTFTVTMPRSL